MCTGPIIIIDYLLLLFQSLQLLPLLERPCSPSDGIGAFPQPEREIDHAPPSVTNVHGAFVTCLLPLPLCLPPFCKVPERMGTVIVFILALMLVQFIAVDGIVLCYLLLLTKILRKTFLLLSNWNSVYFNCTWFWRHFCFTYWVCKRTKCYVGL